jgi:acetylornithine deacetylase/succinyl-diaminopimelate desuccinylase-like protein
VLAGGLLQALQGVESFLQTSQSLPLNVKFLLEGQEEVGSPNLEAFLRKHREGLLAGIDMAISADGGQIAADQPGECEAVSYCSTSCHSLQPSLVTLSTVQTNSMGARLTCWQ